MLLKQEPPLPESILGEIAAKFASLPAGATVCIKISAAYPLPYPFAVSKGFLERFVLEVLEVNPNLTLILTEGGVGQMSVLDSISEQGLDKISGVRFVDAESVEPVYVRNPSPVPLKEEGFWLPRHWVEADMRVLLTTCKLRSHHFQRWFSGGTRNLIGLLPRKTYKLSSSKREMRSVMHQKGMDAMVADLYATAGKDVLTILDGRFIARQDEHIPLRFVRKLGKVIVAEDPAVADVQMTKLLNLPFNPPYLKMISETQTSNQTALKSESGI